MSGEQPDHTLEFLIGFNGRRHYFEDGSFLKFEIKKVRPMKSRPHGLAYSFSLHDPDGERLLGFDNAHSVRAPSGRKISGRSRRIIGTGGLVTKGCRISLRALRSCWMICLMRLRRCWPSGAWAQRL